ncbi:MAG: hypothetical protein HKN25_14220, partial [Pyrinomonadaceae bacterium]|nr:hypothetical protein [Pyrinomonadaceae bacterium]
MKKVFLTIGLVVVLFSVAAFAQKPKSGKETLSIDKVLEADAAHNLNVAWQYFKLRKAYKAVLMRTDETLAAHPTFSKIDEIFYLHGMSSYYLANGKGKQKLDLEKLSKEDRERFSKENL